MTQHVRPAASASWPLVGRDEELRLLGAGMDDESVAGLALAGPAGVGKTRLARQAAELATLRGFPTIAIRASTSAAGIPLAALAPLFAELGVDPEDLHLPLRVMEAVAARGASNRLVLIVDDAQDLDASSAAVMDQLVGLPGTFIVLTVRTGVDGAGTVDLWKDERIRRVDVSPLTDADVRALVQAVLGGPVDGAALRALGRASQGNSLYLRELLQGALESGALRSEQGLWRLSGSLIDSPRLRDLIEHRLQGLGEEGREAIELVALGEPLELSFLRNLVPLEVIEDLERRNVLDGTPSRHDVEIRLGHPLYGEVVRARLSPVRRARLSGRLADSREAAGASGARDLLRVAVWRLDSGGGSPELMVEAAKIAFKSEDLRLAARLAGSAWEHSRSVEAAILFTDALDPDGRATEYEAVLREAYPLARNDEERTAIATRLSSCLFVWQQRVSDAEEVLQRARAEVSGETCRHLVEGQHATQLLLQGDVKRAIEVMEPILASGTGIAHVQASRDYGVALSLAGRSGDALAYTEAALRDRRDIEEQDQLTTSAIYLVARAVALSDHGELQAAVDLAKGGYAAAVELHNRDAQAWFAAICGLTLVTQGRLESAAHLFRETATAFREIGHPGRRWGLGGIALALAQTGDATSAKEAVAELDAVGPNSISLMDVHVARGRAWSALVNGDLAAARAILWDAVGLAEDWGQLGAMVAALHELARVGDAGPAADRLEALGGSVDGPLATARTFYARARAKLDPDLAAEAASMFERCSANLFAAEASFVERRAALDHGLARRASAAGDRARQLLTACENARTPGIADEVERVALSMREREVAVLASEGLASKEIAARLFVSTRTVENHLQRVYVKLGVARRSELRIGCAARTDLSPPGATEPPPAVGHVEW